MTPKSYVHSYYPWKILSCLRYIFVIEPSIVLTIIYERILSYKFCTAWALVAQFSIANATNGFGRTMLQNVLMIISTKYPCSWWCISENWILYTCKNMFLVTAPSCTMNSMRPQPNFLDLMRKWYMMSLTFEAQISSFLASLYISFVVWR